MKRIGNMSYPEGPLFKWFGSKWLSSKTLPAPRHSKIVEPYAGCAAYSLRYYWHDVVIWDTDPHLRVLWPWLIHEATEALVREIPLGVAEGTDIRTLGLSLGQATLLKTWQRTNNVGDCWTISPWGNKPGQWTANTRARVAEEISCVKHWAFMPVEWSDSGVTYFIDPPYEFNYRYRGNGVDYAELAGRVRHAEMGGNQVIVCEARCPKTDRAPEWLPFVDWASRITSRRKAGEHHHSRELIYTNC